MDKAKYKKMYELADKLSKVDAASLTEQQLAERDQMIQRLQEFAQGVAEGLGNKKVTIQGLKNWIAKAQAEGYEVEEVMKGEMWRAVNPKTGGLKGTFHTTDTPGRGSLWGSGPDGTPANSGTLVIKQGVAEGRYYPSPHDYDSDIDYYAAVDRYLGKKGPRPGDDDWEETAPGDGFGDEDDEKTNEADAPRPTYNVMKLGGALDIDPRMLRVAITRGLQGQATRTDMSVLARSFLNMISNSDDKDIQYIANLIKTGNPRPMAQENTAAIAERNAFVNAMRNVKQGEKFSVGGKEYTKTTKHGEDSEVTENINKEAYDRLKRVFDFSNFKGDV